MKAIKITAPGKLEMENAPLPDIDPGEVLLRVAYGGICGSDVHIYHGKNPRVKYPLIMGHEMSGVIADVGARCDKSWKTGDRVVVNPLISCGVCDPCRRGNVHVCERLGLIGIDTDGAFAEYVKAKPSQLIRIPEGMDMDLAALAEPFAVGVHAVNRSGMKVGDRIVVLGGGPIGLMVALAARAAGAGMVAVGEVSQFRLEKAAKMGFETINPINQNTREKVLEMTGGIGADIVFEAAAAAPTSAQMTGLLRTRGTAVIVGVHRQPVNVDLQDVNLRELYILGTRVYTENDFKAAVNLMPGIRGLEEVVTHRLPLGAAQQGFDAMVSAGESLKVLLGP